VDKRYCSQIILPEIGQAGQNKLAAAKVLCVGAGGLATAVVPYLVASGVGQITVCDGDIIEESNLNRQICFTPADIGKNKALTLVDKLAQQNPSVTLIAVANNLTLHNCGELVAQHDLVLDCSDDYSSKLLINDTCRQFNTAWVYASVLGFDGQVILFANRQTRDEVPCLRCYLQHVPITQQSCNISGVLGASVSLVGSYQATLALQALLGNFELALKYYLYNLPLDIKFLYKPTKNPIINQIMLDGRKESNASPEPTNSKGVRTLMKHFQDGGDIGILPDNVAAGGSGGAGGQAVVRGGGDIFES